MSVRRSRHLHVRVSVICHEGLRQISEAEDITVADLVRRVLAALVRERSSQHTSYPVQDAARPAQRNGPTALPVLVTREVPDRYRTR